MKGQFLQGRNIKESWLQIFSDLESPCSRFKTEENQPGWFRSQAHWPKELSHLIDSPGMWNGERYFVKGKVGASTGKREKRMQPSGRTDSTTKVVGAFYGILRYRIWYIFFFKIIFTICGHWDTTNINMNLGLEGGRRGGS